MYLFYSEGTLKPSLSYYFQHQIPLVLNLICQLLNPHHESIIDSFLYSLAIITKVRLVRKKHNAKNEVVFVNIFDVLLAER